MADVAYDTDELGDSGRVFFQLGAALSLVKFLVREQLGGVLADQISTMRNCRTIEDLTFLPCERG